MQITIHILSREALLLLFDWSIFKLTHALCGSGFFYTVLNTPETLFATNNLSQDCVHFAKYIFLSEKKSLYFQNGISQATLSK